MSIRQPIEFYFILVRHEKVLAALVKIIDAWPGCHWGEMTAATHMSLKLHQVCLYLLKLSCELD